MLAQAGESVILVDTDLRRYAPQRQPGSPTIGLTGLLLEDVKDPNVALMNTRWPHLKLLPSGILPPNPSELLTSDKMIKVIDQLRGMADYVIFDTPPILAVTDAVILAARTDGTIIVTAAGKTRTEQLRETVRLLRQANARMIGVVLNRAAGAHAPYYYKRGEKPEIVQSVADPNDAGQGHARARGPHGRGCRAAAAARTLTDLAPLAAAAAAAADIEQPALRAQPSTDAPAPGRRPSRPVSPRRRSLVEELARLTEQQPRAVEAPPRVEVARDGRVKLHPRLAPSSSPARRGCTARRIAAAGADG